MTDRAARRPPTGRRGGRGCDRACRDRRSAGLPRDSDKPPAPGGDDGSSRSGPRRAASTTADATGTGSPGTTAIAVVPGLAVAAGPAPAGPTCGPSYQVSKGPLGVNTTVAVTITNQGTADSTGWTVAIRLSGRHADRAARPGRQPRVPRRPARSSPRPGRARRSRPAASLTFTFGVKGVNVERRRRA